LEKKQKLQALSSSFLELGSKKRSMGDGDGKQRQESGENSLKRKPKHLHAVNIKAIEEATRHRNEETAKKQPVQVPTVAPDITTTAAPVVATTAAPVVEKVLDYVGPSAKPSPNL
tara:strand:- start:3590 stop:3934 length:345 start_codon:yes stop_codon:yes gene_type:complete